MAFASVMLKERALQNKEMRRRCGKPDQIETPNELQVVPTDTCHDFNVEVARFDYRLADAMLSGFLKKY
jgi:hypothetical protein